MVLGCSYFANFGADDAKVAENYATPLLVLDENDSVPVSGLRGRFVQGLGGYSVYVKKRILQRR
jgi:hypothetical protein